MSDLSSTPLSYCPQFPEVSHRLRSLYERQAPDRIFAVTDTPSPALEAFAQRYREGYCEYPDAAERLAFWDAHLAREREVFDDGVPAAYLSECDQGLYGGSAGGQVRYMAHPENGWISSMVPPLLESLSQLDTLRFDSESVPFRRFCEQLDVFRRGSDGRFGLSHFILIDSLNFIFELVGATNTYLALIEEPDLVRRAIDFAFDLNVMVQETFFDADVLIEGGTCSNMAEWLPGRVVSESLDPFHMTSVDDFERWGREPAERIIGHFDGGVIHIHGNGRHLLEAASTLRGLRAALLGDDRGFPPAFEILPEVRARVGDLPLVAGCGHGEFARGLREHTLTGGVLYKVAGVPDADTANRLMDRVRAYRC